MNLTGRSYALAVLIIALGIIGEWGPAALAGLWRIPAAAALLLLAYEGVNARRRSFELGRDVPAKSRLGVETDGTLRLDNPGHWPLEALALDESPEGVGSVRQILAFSIPPGESRSEAFTYNPQQLGEPRWDRVLLRIRGRLGLAWWSRKRALASRTNVIPDHLAENERLRSGSDSGGDLNRPRPGGGLELLGLREYRAGDPVNSIDWKATARSGRTTVRVMSDEQRLELVLLIDTGRSSGTAADGLTRLGHYTNVAARLTEKALLNGDRVHLFTFADRVQRTAPGLRSHAGLVQARHLLEGLRPSAASANPLPAVMEVRRRVRRRSLVVLFSDLDDGEAAAQLVEAMALLRPTHLPVVAGIMDPEVVALAEGEARHWLDPYENLAARELVESWRHIAYRLNRLGAEVVLTPPARLDASVLRCYGRLRERRLV